MATRLTTLDRTDDEIGLNNDFKSDHRRYLQDSTEDGIALDNSNGIMVSHDLEWSSIPALHV